MTPTLTIRSFTNDQYILDKVFYSNFYRLKGLKDANKKPVVVDLGAHCGYFTFAAVSLGAEKVYAFEIHPENYKILLKNTSHPSLSDKVKSFNFGVYTKFDILEFKDGDLVDKLYLNWADLVLAPTKEEADYSRPAFTLDFILEKFVTENVDILKLNIGYAEIEILSGSKLIETRVDNICLEIKEDILKINDLINTMKTKGFKYSSISKVSEEDGAYVILFSKSKCEDTFSIN